MKLRESCTLIIGKKTLLSLLGEGLSAGGDYEDKVRVTMCQPAAAKPNQYEPGRAYEPGTANWDQFVLTVEPMHTEVAAEFLNKAPSTLGLGDKY